MPPELQAAYANQNRPQYNLQGLLTDTSTPHSDRISTFFEANPHYSNHTIYDPQPTNTHDTWNH